MTVKYYQDGKCLCVGENKLIFDFNIRFVKETKNILIVLLDIPYDVTYLDNVFGVSYNGNIKWRIQSIGDVFPVKKQLPFENLMISENEVFVSDFYGRKYLVNSENGNILSSHITR